MRKVRLAVASAGLLLLLAGDATAQGTDSSSDKGVLNPLLDLLLGHPRRQSDVPPPPGGSSGKAAQKPKPKNVAAKPVPAVAGLPTQNKPSTRPIGTIAPQQRTGFASRTLLPLNEAPQVALPPPVPPPLMPPTDDRSLAPPADAAPTANIIPVAPPADAIPLAPPADAASTDPAADAAPGSGDAMTVSNPAMNAGPAPGSSVFPPPDGSAAANPIPPPNMPLPRPNSTASADATALPAIVDPSQSTTRTIGLPTTVDNQANPAVGEPPQGAAPSSDVTQQAANGVAPMAQDDGATADGTSHRSSLTKMLGGFGGAIIAGAIAWFLLGFGPRRDYAGAEAAAAPAPAAPPSPPPSPRPNKPAAKRPAR